MSPTIPKCGSEQSKSFHEEAIVIETHPHQHKGNSFIRALEKTDPLK
jgi:hypothetical protein